LDWLENGAFLVDAPSATDDPRFPAIAIIGSDDTEWNTTWLTLMVLVFQESIKLLPARQHLEMVEKCCNSANATKGIIETGNTIVCKGELSRRFILGEGSST